METEEKEWRPSSSGSHETGMLGQHFLVVYIYIYTELRNARYAQT